MKKILIPIIVLLLLSISIVSADELQGFIDQPTTISTVCIRNSQIRTNVTVTVRIYNEQGVMVAGPVNSTPGGNGTFSTSFVFAAVGKYATKETCDFGDYLADGSTAINVIKPMFGTMQVMAQSIAQVSLNKTAKAEWLLLLPNSTGAANSSISVANGSCTVYSINGTLLSVSPDTIVSGDKLTTFFRTDPAYGFAEDENFEINCNIALTGGLSVTGVKNYLYVNPHLTYFQFLGQILSDIGQVLGIVQQSQATINQTLSITNQTLQIVTNLNTTSGGSTEILANTQNILTIINESYTISLSGTDYMSGDNGRVFLKLVKNDVALDDQVCMLSIHNPASVTNATSYFVYNALMRAIGTDGLYYYDFTAPDAEGIYMVSARCFVGQNTQVFLPTSDVLVQGAVVSGSLADVIADVGAYYVLREQDNGGENRSYVHDFYFNVSSMDLNLTNFVAVQFIGYLDNGGDGEKIKMQVYNWSGNSYVDLSNMILSQTGTNDVMVSNTGNGTLMPVFRNSSGMMKIRFIDTLRVGDKKNNQLHIDHLYAGGTTIVSQPVKDIAGGGELNIRQGEAIMQVIS